jgi:hypothetical protein
MNGFNSVEDIFQGIRLGEIGARDRPVLAEPVPTDVAVPCPSADYAVAPAHAAYGSRWHEGTPGFPALCSCVGTGSAPIVRITQKLHARQRCCEQRGDPANSRPVSPMPCCLRVNGLQAMQAALGGEYIPVPPMVGLQYAQSPEKMAEKLRQAHA